jgi:anti-sigma regulatory factor (Ser/Thr protein kinase)
VHLLEGKELMPVVARTEEGDLGPALDRLLARHRPNLGDPAGPGAVVASGTVEVLDRIPGEVLEDLSDGEADAGILATVAPRSAAIVPLRGQDGPLGALSLVRTRKERFTPAEIEFLEEIGRRAGRGLESALLYEQERDIAWTLQHQLLPKTLPELEGLRTHAVYEPGTAGAEIGGDWYDVIDLGDHRVAVCVGDVVGHGHEAAAAMGQLRVAVRAHALEGHVPAVVVARLSELTNDLGVPLVTLCYSELQLVEGIVVSVSAGHPPPLVVTDDRAEFLEIASDPALGARPDWRYHELTTVLDPRSCLLFYTDGLVESRLAGIDEGLERLRRAARRSVGEPRVLVESVLAAMRPQMSGLDDTVVCAVCPELGAVTRTATRLVSGHLASVGSVRHWAQGVVASWGHDRSLCEALELLLSELVTNAITYSAGAVRIHLQNLPDAIEVAVSDRSPRPPRFQNPTPSTEFGRGLQIVHQLSSSVDIVEEEGFGKTIRCRIPLGVSPNGPSAADHAVRGV